ncbi:hypothetical protein ACFCZC_20820 [Bacillus subtilis]
MLCSMEIPEKAQAEALARVAELGTQRAQLLADAKALLPQIKEAALAAARIDAPRSRIQQLSKVSTAVVYGWFDEAGLPKLKGGKGGV